VLSVFSSSLQLASTCFCCYYIAGGDDALFFTVDNSNDNDTNSYSNTPNQSIVAARGVKVTPPGSFASQMLGK
jgi:hypothetical protein